MTDSANAPLLIELGCEELPPKSLDLLAQSFFESVCDGLEKAGLAFARQDSRWLASPRRIALIISGVEARQPDQVIQKRGPAAQAAFDSDGQPTPAATGFAKSVGADVADLQRVEQDGREYLYFEVNQPGKALADILFPLLEQAAARLPVPKPMRWSNHDFSFVRPIHWLITLHGDAVLEGTLFGLNSGRSTRGHRVHAPGPHEIATADEYVSTLRAAFVMVDQDERRQKIEADTTEISKKLSVHVFLDANLLEEVKNLVEWPVCLVGGFDEDFLNVPSEALVSSMQSHQKYFPVFSDTEKAVLDNRFVTVANLESSQPDAVIEGNERVIRPRLADARFFWDQDRKQTLSEWKKALDSVVFQKKLGSVGDKTIRIGELSRKIAEQANIDPAAAKRAADLAKCDLLSQMVSEFPDLQGVMGGYYAEADGESAEVASAIREHYLPRFAGDDLPETDAGWVVALADRIDTLFGIFAIGQKPTGAKDPFALRRAALGCIRLLQNHSSGPGLDDLFSWSEAAYGENLEADTGAGEEVKQFVLERLKNQCREQGFSAELFNAVVAVQDNNLLDFASRLSALQKFSERPESESLAAANKRISNILRKSASGENFELSDIKAHLEEEKDLLEAVNKITGSVSDACAAGDYTTALDQLADLKVPVDAFFEHIMVMDEDPDIRRSRLALVSSVHTLFQQVANISALAK